MQSPRNRNDQLSEQEELKYRNDMLTTIINNSEAGVYVTDYHTGEILFANQQTVALFGNHTSVDALIGQICWKVISGGIDTRCKFCPYKKLVDKNGALLAPHTWEYHFDKYGIWAKITNQAIQWIDGRIAQITTFHDITETKRMQRLLSEHIRVEEQLKMQQSLQIILDSLPLPVRVVDVETAEITYVNNTFLKVFEYTSAEEVTGHPALMLVSISSNRKADYWEKMHEVYLSEDVSSTEIEYCTATGKTFFALLTNCIISYNGRKSAVGIITDLTAEREQRRLLMQAAEREREANQLKSSFLSNMSHEIRTPMNAIIGLTEMELRRKPQKEALTVYKKINNSAKNLLQILNDILDLSKIEANKVELFPVEFELEDLLNSVLLVVTPRLEGKQVELILDLSLDLPRFMIGDKTRLWQILRNLLDNAAKFTARGSITLSVSENKEISTSKTAYVSFVVTDTGSGMSEEQISKIFLPYEQLQDEGNMRHGGTGLGLPISKQLCELMSGELEVKSWQGHGTLMRFTIPLARLPGKEAELKTLSPQRLSELNVLIVDDSELSIHAMKGLLHSCGASISTAYSGKEAIKIILERTNVPPFDIIVLDYIMDEMNGLECAKLMRRHLPPSVKIIILTAYENLLSKDELEICGVDDVIEKPFVPTYFLRKLTDCLDDNPHYNTGQPEALTKFKDTTVLVCEDIEINQEIILSMLEQFGVSAVLADNGSRGIELLDSEQAFDLLFMDLHMPVMDGYEAVSAIRSKPKYGDLPVIGLTADAMVETLNACLSIGFNDVITKPTTFEDLHRILLKWLPKNKRKDCGGVIA